PRSKGCGACRRPRVPEDGRSISVRTGVGTRSIPSKTVPARQRTQARQPAKESCDPWDSLLFGFAVEEVSMIPTRGGRLTGDFTRAGRRVKRSEVPSEPRPSGSGAVRGCCRGCLRLNGAQLGRLERAGSGCRPDKTQQGFLQVLGQLQMMVDDIVDFP